jgi:hypothetical protein
MLDEARRARQADPCSGRGSRYGVRPDPSIRQGSRHEFWELGGFRFAVPRHRDINEWTAEAIMRELEPMLGEDWWRP